MLSSIEPQVLVAILSWRREQHFAVANCLKESWLLGRNLAALKDVTLQTAVDTEESMQLLLVKMLLKRLGSLTVEENGRAGPRVVGQSTGLNAEKVEVYAKVFVTFRIYMERLKQKYDAVWDNCSMAWKLIRRVFVAGEPGLLTNLETWTQLRGLSLDQEMNVADVLALEEHLKTLHEKLRAQAVEARVEPPAEVEMEKRAAELLAEARAAREAAEKEAAAKQASLKQQAAAASADQDSKTEALAKLEKARAAMETDPSPRTASSRTDGPSSQQLETKVFLQATSYLQLSCWNTISDSARAADWRLWVIPPINSKRGPSKLGAGKSRCMRRFPWSPDVQVQDAVVLCLGHDPSGMEQAQDVFPAATNLHARRCCLVARKGPQCVRMPQDAWNKAMGNERPFTWQALCRTRFLLCSLLVCSSMARLCLLPDARRPGGAARNAGALLRVSVAGDGFGAWLLKQEWVDMSMTCACIAQFACGCVYKAQRIDGWASNP